MTDDSGTVFDGLFRKLKNVEMIFCSLIRSHWHALTLRVILAILNVVTHKSSRSSKGGVMACV